MAAPDSPLCPAAGDVRQSGGRVLVVVLAPVIARGDALRLCERVRILLEGSSADLLIWDVAALRTPDVVAVDALARMQLTARRLGRIAQLRHASRQLQELLALTGLSEVLPLSARSSPELEGRQPVNRNMLSGTA